MTKVGVKWIPFLKIISMRRSQNLLSNQSMKRCFAIRDAHNVLDPKVWLKWKTILSVQTFTLKILATKTTKPRAKRSFVTTHKKEMRFFVKMAILCKELPQNPWNTTATPNVKYAVKKSLWIKIFTNASPQNVMAIFTNIVLWRKDAWIWPQTDLTNTFHKTNVEFQITMELTINIAILKT